jgi:hypothetical protein
VNPRHVFILGCLPSAPSMVEKTTQAAAAATPPPTPTPPSTTHAGAPGTLHPHCRLLYANETLYVLLRLHHLLYERLRTARECSMAKVCVWGG